MGKLKINISKKMTNIYQPKKKTKLRKLVSTIDEKDSSRFHKSYAYYESLAKNYRITRYLDKEKVRLHTNPQSNVTNKINLLTSLAQQDEGGIFAVLKNIYHKNLAATAKRKAPPLHNDILNIVAHPDILIVAYKKIKPNKGATSKGAQPPLEWWNKVKEEDKEGVKRILTMPDGISLKEILLISQLIKQGKYQWGYSRRIYVEKPGHKEGDKKRPITIPLFADRMVQEAIRMVLEAIYEPWFTKANVSFGFRSNYSCHDAIVRVAEPALTQGFTTAIEGDIEGAYDNVNPEVLLYILSKRIKDKHFLNFMKERLKMKLFFVEEKKYQSSFLGIPQGGIDSPYLFNIYMHEFDEFVIKYLKVNMARENKKRRAAQEGKQNIRNSQYSSYSSAKNLRLRNLREINHKLNLLLIKKEKTKEPHILSRLNDQIDKLKRRKYATLRQVRSYGKLLFRTPSKDQTRKRIKAIYTRYADDWIILGNFSKQKGLKIKKDLGLYLKEILRAKLSEKKTLVTNLREEPAHFLGFEIKASKTKKVTNKMVTVTQVRPSNKQQYTFKKKVKARVTSERLLVFPDSQRLISRLNMKGYCNKYGSPKSLPWLSTMEAFSIVMKYNGVTLGMANYYLPFVTYKSSMERWLYIIRWSCFHTLAQKFKTSLRQIKKRYFNGKTKVFSIPVTISHKKDKYIKYYTLYDSKQAYKKALATNRRYKVLDTYNNLAKGINPKFTRKSSIPSVKDTNFLDKITWVKWRTKALLDIACAICGKENELEMHHIRSIRKSQYVDIPEEKGWPRVMSLRNRKQICVCKTCHNNIHKGTYAGTSLNTLYDNRIVNMEGYIRPRKKPLVDKPIDPNKLEEKVTKSTITRLLATGWEKLEE